MKKLTKELVQKNNAPTKILQFGEGNFMRGFVDWQIQQLNNQELYRGNVTIVQPLPMGLGEMLNNQDNLYTVILQGLLDGEIIDSSEVITVVDDVINPYQQWNHNRSRYLISGKRSTPRYASRKFPWEIDCFLI